MVFSSQSPVLIEASLHGCCHVAKRPPSVCALPFQLKSLHVALCGGDSCAFDHATMRGGAAICVIGAFVAFLCALALKLGFGDVLCLSYQLLFCFGGNIGFAVCWDHSQDHRIQQ